MIRRIKDWLLSAGARVLAVAAMMVVGTQTAFGDETAGSYMIVDLTTGDVTYEQADSVNQYTNKVYKTDKMVFRHVPAGTYYVQGGMPALMAADYWIAIYEMTCQQYKRMGGSISQGTRPLAFATDESLSASNLDKFNRNFRGSFLEREPTSGSHLMNLSTNAWEYLNPGIRMNEHALSYYFDLPTEAMWEVATRAMPAGDSSRATWDWFFGTTAPTNVLDLYAIPDGTASTFFAREVGTKLPNEWGLFDVYGNVREMCRDVFPPNTSWIMPDQLGHAGPGNLISVRGGSTQNSYSLNGNTLSSSTRESTAWNTRKLYRGVRLAVVPNWSSLQNMRKHDWNDDGIFDVVVLPPRNTEGSYRYHYFSNGVKVDLAVDAADSDDYQFDADGSMIVPPKTGGLERGEDRQGRYDVPVAAGFGDDRHERHVQARRGRRHPDAGRLAHERGRQG